MNVAGSKCSSLQVVLGEKVSGELCRLGIPLFSNPLAITRLHFLENCALCLLCISTVIAITFLLTKCSRPLIC